MLKFVALTRPVRAAASTSAADSPAVIASGFSQTTCLPAARIAAPGRRADRWARSRGRRPPCRPPAGRRGTGTRCGTPSTSARAAPRSGELPSTPRTSTPIRRSASTWTVPMNPVPMTAAPMSAILSMDWCIAPFWSSVGTCLDHLDDRGLRSAEPSFRGRLQIASTSARGPRSPRIDLGTFTVQNGRSHARHESAMD